MKVRIRDISLGGCLVEAPLPVQVGQHVTLQLDLPGDGSLSLEGETVRVHDRLKLAVEFRNLSGTTRRRLQEVITYLIATSPAATLDRATDSS